MLSSEKIGRPVRVTALSFSRQPFDEVFAVVDAEGSRGADLIILPETWRGQDLNQPETLDGETIGTARRLARRYHTYIICPIDRLCEDRRLNSAVLIDRKGEIACVYDKVYPYWSEFDLTPCVEPAADVPVVQTDFGALGTTICFDVNFPIIWQRLADAGAELVVWPSAYSGGTSLQAHAINHHYYIITATGSGDCTVYDITGREMLYEKATGIHVTRVTLDLDRGIYHENFNDEKLQPFLRQHGEDVFIEERYPREGWFVLKSKRPGISARSLAREHGLEELRDYLSRSREQIDQRRSPCTAPLSTLA